MWMYSEKRWTLHPATWYGRPFVFRASGACSFCWLSFCVSGMLQSWHFVASPKCRQSLDTGSSRLHFVTMSMFTDVCLWESFPSGWMCGIPCFFFARFRKMSWNSYRHKGHDHVYFYFMTFIVQVSSHCFWMQSYVLLLESTAGKAFATAADPVASDVASLNSTFWWFFLQLQMRDFNWFFNNYNFWGGQVHQGLLSQVRGGHLFCTDVVSDQGWRWDDETFLRLSPASIYMYIYTYIHIFHIYLMCISYISRRLPWFFPEILEVWVSEALKKYEASFSKEAPKAPTPEAPREPWTNCRLRCSGQVQPVPLKWRSNPTVSISY